MPIYVDKPHDLIAWGDERFGYLPSQVIYGAHAAYRFRLWGFRFGRVFVGVLVKVRPPAVA